VDALHHRIGGEKLGGWARLPGGGIIPGINQQADAIWGAVIWPASLLHHHGGKQVDDAELAQVLNPHCQQIIAPMLD
jgi:hypothetical protein